MKNRNTANDSMYSGVECDVCKGPTLLMPSGSIWCSAEDPHPGGHFVKRVAFERAPGKAPRKSVVEIAKGDGATYLTPIKPRTSAPVQNLNKTPSPFGEASYDDFVKGSES